MNLKTRLNIQFEHDFEMVEFDSMLESLEYYVRKYTRINPIERLCSIISNL